MHALVALTFALAAQDPLFQKMEGTWIGHGERVQLISGEHVRIESKTQAAIVGGRLESRNEITETPDHGAPRTYARDYWILPDATQAGAYVFGVQDTATSRGHLRENILELEQNMGDYVIRSRTRFDGQGSDYEEALWHGERQLTRTQIHYQH
jgi:hypothetical protein